MRIMAIDPGDVDSGYVIMEGYKPIKFGKLSNTELLNIITLNANDLDMVVIEMIASYGKAVGANVHETTFWVGQFYRHAVNMGVNVDRIYRMEEKMAICHDSRAKDTNIRTALIDRFADHDKKGGKGTKTNPDWFYGFKADVWMAYAVGVTYLDKKQKEIIER